MTVLITYVPTTSVIQYIFYAHKHTNRQSCDSILVRTLINIIILNFLFPQRNKAKVWSNTCIHSLMCISMTNAKYNLTNYIIDVIVISKLIQEVIWNCKITQNWQHTHLNQTDHFLHKKVIHFPRYPPSHWLSSIVFDVSLSNNSYHPSNVWIVKYWGSL